MSWLLCWNYTPLEGRAGLDTLALKRNPKHCIYIFHNSHKLYMLFFYFCPFVRYDTILFL